MGQRRSDGAVDYDKIERLARAGLTERQIRDACGCSKEDLEARGGWEEILRIIRYGRASGIGDVAHALYETALKGTVSAQLYYLKTHGRWGEQGDGEGERYEPVPRREFLAWIDRVLADRPHEDTPGEDAGD